MIVRHVQYIYVLVCRSASLSLFALSLHALVDALLMVSCSHSETREMPTPLKPVPNPQNNYYMFDLYSLFPPKCLF